MKKQLIVIILFILATISLSGCTDTSNPSNGGNGGGQTAKQYAEEMAEHYLYYNTDFTNVSIDKQYTDLVYQSTDWATWHVYFWADGFSNWKRVNMKIWNTGAYDEVSITTPGG